MSTTKLIALLVAVALVAFVAGATVFKRHATASAPERSVEPDQYTWAFAQNLDGSFNRNEVCRESLAASTYAPVNAAKTMREGGSNVFLFRGTIESYRIYGFHSQAECETALTAMFARQRQR